jgi:dipeptidyl-peptidase-4
MRGLSSPDGRWVLLEDAGNLSVLDGEVEGTAAVVTTDGEALYGYGTRPGAASTARLARSDGEASPPVAVWSPDSRRIVVHRLDERRVGELHLVEHLPRPDDRRTALRVFRHPLAGDADAPLADLWLVDVTTATCIRVDLPPQPLLWVTPIEQGRVWWSDDGRRVYVVLSERGERALELYEVDAANGSARSVLREEGATYVEANLDITRQPNVRVLCAERELIWFSERSGWGHLELRDLATGALIRPLTYGEWVVRDIVHVDAAARTVWFTAGGREAGRDPYYRHLYRVSLDGGDAVLLTPEDADHQIAVDSSSTGYQVVDEYARVDAPTHCVTRDLWSGQVIEHRWEHAAAPTTAEPFVVLARDETTELHGLLFRPTDFDANRRYPVIDHVYGFPQTTATPKRSPIGPWQTLADHGYVVILLDGLGTPYRSKAFHNASYARLEDATLPDHVAALHQLAERHAWIDGDRVGVFGSSGGGATTVRALLEYPDVFHVGVAVSGGYDHRDSIAYILEKYQGPDANMWHATDLTRIAERLEGRLLLVWGELDDNVHPLSSIRMLRAFIEADKDVDVLVIPGADHTVWAHPYVQRRLIQYFTQHL